MNTIFYDKCAKPIYVLGLQAHNSSNGYWELIERAIQAVDCYHGNTLEVPVYWCQFEPEEGRYDRSQIQQLIERVRLAGLHLIVLWFGFSKNADMTCAPEWVKADTERFWRAVGPDGGVTPQLSPFCQAGIEADRRAFVEFMKTIRAEDEAERTVIAVQVENEIGLYPLDRCYSATAQRAFVQGVPDQLMDIIVPDSGTANVGRDWYEHFGRHAHEVFTCWYFAQALESIAAAGKAVYNLPMYANAVAGELRQEIAGQSYSSGSPVGRMLDIYRCGAPSIDVFAPDIYLAHRSGYLRICAAHARCDNPLFIPETGTSGEAFAANILHAAGDFGAIGICGFGAEHTLNSCGELLPASKPVADSMNALAQMAPILLKYGGTDSIFAISQEEYQELAYVKRSRWHITFYFTSRGKKGMPLGRSMRVAPKLADDPECFNQRGRVLVYEANENEYYFAGVGCNIRFLRRAEPHDTCPCALYMSRAATEVAAISIEEGHFDADGSWICEYVRRGDEVDCGAFVYPGIVLRVKLNQS